MHLPASQHDRRALSDASNRACSLVASIRPSSTPIPGLAELHVRLGRDRDVHAGACGHLGLGAAAAEVGADAVLAAGQDGAGGVDERADVGRLDLDHVAGLRARERLDVGERVAPLVGDDLDASRASGARAAR